MSETQADYKRLESERFELIKFSCPWRNTPKIRGESFCLATTELCKITDCGVYHFVKALSP